MTLEGIYNGEFNDRAEPFRVTLTLGSESNNHWVNASRTKVEKIDHKEVHLVLDVDLAHMLRSLFANTLHDVVDYEPFGEDYEYNDMYEEVEKVVDLEEGEIVLVIERPQTF